MIDNAQRSFAFNIAIYVKNEVFYLILYLVFFLLCSYVVFESNNVCCFEREKNKYIKKFM